MSKSQQKISQEVLDQIKSGEIKMHSRTYFTLLSASIITTSVVTGIVMSYLSSIIFFWIRITVSGSAAFGARRNLSELLSSFPWWAVLAIIALIIFITILIRKYGTLYRHKTSNIILVILLISIILGAGMSALGVGDFKHSGLNNQQNQQNGPWWNN